MNNKLNIKLITREPFPIGMAATNRIINYARGLIKYGFHAEVYIIHSTYKKPSDKTSSGVFKGIPFRFANSAIRSNSFIKRRFDDIIDFCKSCIDILKDNKSNVNFIYVNSFFKEFVFVCLSKIKNIKVVRELCEYPCYKECFMSKIYLKFLFPFYDGFVTISENLYNLAESNCCTSAKIIKIPILLDKNDISDIKPFIHSKPYIFHGGTLTESKDALISTIKAFAIANKKLRNSIDFIIAGPASSDLSIIKQIIKDENLGNNIIFLGKITHDQILKYLTGASLCILNKNDTIQNQYGFSTKLSDILLTETPVITTKIGEACNWLKDGESAYITEPHRPELIADLIVEAFTNENKRTEIAKKGKEIALTNFDISVQGVRLADFLNNI